MPHRRSVVVSCLLVSTLVAFDASAQCPIGSFGATDLGRFLDFADAKAVARTGEWLAVGMRGADAAGASSGAVHLYRFDGSEWRFQQVLLGSDTDGSDHFGDAVIAEGTTLVVGAPEKDIRGAVYVFERVGETWVETQILVPETLAFAWDFGMSLALEGNVLVVGDSGGFALGSQTGAAYVFRRSGGLFVEEARLVPADVIDDDLTGVGLAIDGDVIAIGATAHDVDACCTAGGAVFVYEHDGSGWVFQQRLTGSDTGFHDQFGVDIELDGDAMLIGASGQGGGTFSIGPGAVYLFERSAGFWSESQVIQPAGLDTFAGFGNSMHLTDDSLAVGAWRDGEHGAVHLFARAGADFLPVAVLEPEGGAGDMQFGTSLHLEGEHLVVGAPNSEFAGVDTGLAFYFRDLGAGFGQAQVLSPLGVEEGDRFGAAMSGDADVAVIGAPGVATPAGGVGVGQAIVYRRDGLQWVREAKLENPEPTAALEFGATTSVDGDRAAIGAPGGGGAAWVFREIAGLWVEEAELIPAASDPESRFGEAVAIDGVVAVVGAPVAAGLQPAAGAVHVFEFDGSAWSEEVVLVAPAAGGGDSFGTAVAIEGDRMVVGAPGDDTGGSEVGAAYLYEFFGGAWVETALLLPDDLAPNGRFGTAVVVRDPLILITAPGRDGERGAAYIFRRDGGSWSQEAMLTLAAGESGDQLGASIDLRFGHALVGAPGAASAGRAVVFVREGTTWSEQNVFDGPPAPGAKQGSAVLLDDDLRGLIGAPMAPFGGVDAGAVRSVSVSATPDCDGDGVADFCAFLTGVANDCNDNGVPDTCDIAEGTSPDVNGNGIPDECDPFFRRGDCNVDGVVDIADAIRILMSLFVGGPSFECAIACDANGDSSANIADSVFLLNFLFGDGAAPPAPYPDCALEAGPSGSYLDCAIGNACP